MVTFTLISNDGTKLVFWYYPEDKKEFEPGIIEVDLSTHDIRITKIAEEDAEDDIPPEELNELAESINRMKRERGEADFVEMETEPMHTVYYGDHAVSEILKHLREGNIPEKGMQAWY